MFIATHRPTKSIKGRLTKLNVRRFSIEVFKEATKHAKKKEELFLDENNIENDYFISLSDLKEVIDICLYLNNMSFKIEIRGEIRRIKGIYVMRFRWYEPDNSKRQEKCFSTSLSDTKGNELLAYQMMWDKRKEFEKEININYSARLIEKLTGEKGQFLKSEIDRERNIQLAIELLEKVKSN